MAAIPIQNQTTRLTFLILPTVRSTRGRTYEGGGWIDRDAASRAVRGVIEREDERHRAIDTLTSREIEIVRMVAQGLRNGERLKVAVKLLFAGNQPEWQAPRFEQTIYAVVTRRCTLCV